MDDRDAVRVPSLTYLSNPDVAYDVWALWVADEKRHLPSEILQEPTNLLDDVFAIDNYYNSLKAAETPDGN